MKKSEQTKINNFLDNILGSNKSLKNYLKTESNPILQRLAKGANRERVRGLKKDFNKHSKTN